MSDAGGGRVRRLTAEQLALEGGVSLDYLRRLVAVGAVRPQEAGLHSVDDVPRVRLASALAEGGIDEHGIKWAMENAGLQLDRFAGLWSVAEPSGRTFAEFEAGLGQRAALMRDVYAAFGLAVPPPEYPMGAEEEALVTDFIDVWAMVDERPDVALRAARITGEGIRRLQLATLDLFDEFGGSPPARQRRGLDTEDANLPSFRLASVMPRLLVWLLARHNENELFGRVVRFIQSSLAREGRIEARPAEPSAIAFVDLSGYAELTTRIGDELAAETAAKLQVLAQRAAPAHHGDVVKLLGDGVMLRFAAPIDAVRSVLELMTAVREAGLPEAHAGVAAGPLVIRDGDVYGNTVNLASRIAAHAEQGDLLVDEVAAERVQAAGIGLDSLGVARIKGLSEPVRLARVHR